MYNPYQMQQGFGQPQVSSVSDGLMQNLSNTYQMGQPQLQSPFTPNYQFYQTMPQMQANAAAAGHPLQSMPQMQAYQQPQSMFAQVQQQPQQQLSQMQMGMHTQGLQHAQAQQHFSQMSAAAHVSPQAQMHTSTRAPAESSSGAEEMLSASASSTSHRHVERERRRRDKPKKPSVFSRPCKLSTTLADVVGDDMMTRSEVVSRMWKYVRENQLLDPKQKQFAVCDEKLERLIGEKRFRVFGMMKYLKNHISDPGPQVDKSKLNSDQTSDKEGLTGDALKEHQLKTDQSNNDSDGATAQFPPPISQDSEQQSLGVPVEEALGVSEVGPLSGDTTSEGAQTQQENSTGLNGDDAEARQMLHQNSLTNGENDDFLHSLNSSSQQNSSEQIQQQQQQQESHQQHQQQQQQHQQKQMQETQQNQQQQQQPPVTSAPTNISFDPSNSLESFNSNQNKDITQSK